jgi:hypothetical protein
MRELLRPERERPSLFDVSRPHEDTVLKPTREKAQALSVPEDDLDQVGLAAPKDEEVKVCVPWTLTPKAQRISNIH